MGRTFTKKKPRAREVLYNWILATEVLYEVIDTFWSNDRFYSVASAIRDLKCTV